MSDKREKKLSKKKKADIYSNRFMQSINVCIDIAFLCILLQLDVHVVYRINYLFIDLANNGCVHMG